MTVCSTARLGTDGIERLKGWRWREKERELEGEKERKGLVK